MKLYLASPLLCCLLFACTQDEGVELPLSSRQLVASAFINPDSTWTVFVSQVGEKFNSRLAWVDDAELSIYSDGQLIERLQRKDSGMYKGSTLPLSEQRYTLKAEKQGYPAISASATIPSATELLGATHSNKKTYIGGADPKELNSSWTFTFKDPVGIKNYYHLEIYRLRRDNVNNTVLPLKDYLIGNTADEGRKYGIGAGGSFYSLDPVLLSEGDLEYSPSFIFFSDELFDGQTYELSLLMNNSTYQKDSVYATLRTIDESYYKYLKSFTRHLSSRLYNDFNSSDPGFRFVNVPIPIYTNISGGIGIFTAYSSDTKKVKYVQ